MEHKFPHSIYTGKWKTGHIQGIAVDEANGYIYCSFTTKLVKLDLDGNLIGSVGGLRGHLGCLDFCEADGRIYGSLEYKNDVIGKGIMTKIVESDDVLEDGFYIAIFDGDKIVREDMDGAADGIMSAVYLPDVLADYNGRGVHGEEHRYGCSGIDGVSFGPAFGSRDGKYYLNVTYGVYGDVNREDNDYQVVLHYDTSEWKQYEKPLCDTDMHRSGPDAPDAKYFVFTGNTSYGVQNLEYDKNSGKWLMAVYRGKKETYPNYRLYAIDGNVAPKREVLRGIGEEGLVLTLSNDGVLHEGSGVRGWDFPYGATGIHAFGNGYFYISHNGKDEENLQYATVHLYRSTFASDVPFEIVEE